MIEVELKQIQLITFDTQHGALCKQWLH